jgi:GH24 family phage-related lysozyme (muramidase)
LAVAGNATANSATPISCDAGAIQYAIAAGGSYQFDCSGTIYDPQDIHGAAHPFVIPSGTDVSFQSDDESVALDGLGQTQIFIVQAGASLSLSGITLQNAMTVATIGESGEAGIAGTAGAIGTNGNPGSTTGPLNGTDGNAGFNGSAGTVGAAGHTGDWTEGGAIDNAGNLTLTDCAFTADHAIGSQGGPGGAGGAAGNGGPGGAGGSGATPQATGIGGSGGSGGSGATGATGSEGGAGANGEQADGGALYNAPTGTAIISDCTFTNNNATGGSGGPGGNGGTGGSGGGGGRESFGGTGAGGNQSDGGNGGTGGSGGTGGNGGAGGAGGSGGPGQGGAIFNNGGALSIWGSTFSADTANGGSGGPGGSGGSGGIGGQGGQGGNGGDAYQISAGDYAGSGGLPGENGTGGLGGNGGDGGDGGTGGPAFGGAIYSTNQIQVDGNTVPEPPGTQATTVVDIQPTIFANNSVTAGLAPTGCATDNSGCGGNGAESIAAYPPATGGAPTNAAADPGAATIAGQPGNDASENTSPIATGGDNTWIADTSNQTAAGPATDTTGSAAPGSVAPSSTARTFKLSKVIDITGSDASHPRSEHGHLNRKATTIATKQLKSSTSLRTHLSWPRLRSAANTVEHYVHVTLNINQQAALIEFAYYASPAALRGSTLLRDLNAGHRSTASTQLLRWTRTDGRKLATLVRERRQEQKPFLTGKGHTRAHTEPRDHLLSPHTTIKSGHILKLTERDGTPGCKVTLRIAVTGLSPYPILTLPSATITANGSYTVTWHIPKSITDTLPWQLTGNETCPK